MEQIENKKRIDKVLDFIFSKDPRKYVLLITLVAFIIRLILSFRIPYHADESGYSVHAIGFISSGKLQIHDQDALWFFLTDLFMKIFGVNLFGLRFFSVLFGSLSIILVFLIAKKLFNNKIAVLSSLILAFSSYHIIISVGQMDVPMAFFVFLAMYFLILSLDGNNNSKFFLLAWVSIGVAIMIKQIAILFLPALVIFYLFYNKKYYGKFNFKRLFYALIILILMVTPVLTYNYLLYKDKGLVDMQFSRFFGIAEDKYASIAENLNPFSLETLFISNRGGPPGVIDALNMFYTLESYAIMLFAILGIAIIIGSKNKFKWLLFLSLLIPFIFLAGTSLLSNHFVFCTLFFSIFAANGVYFLSNKSKEEKTKKLIIIISILLILFTSGIQLYKFNQGFFGPNEIEQLISFKNKNINLDSLVVVDGRIYRGRIAFAFWDRHYLESSLFPDLVSLLDQLPGDFVSKKIYFIEAVTDDSGWGTIKNQPDFNQSTEELVSLFKNQSSIIGTINDLDGNPHFNIYEGKIAFKEAAFDLVDSTHEFFFYPLLYQPKNEVFDNYQTYGLLDSLLNKFAHLILYLDVILSILLAIFVFYLLYKDF